MAGYYLDTWPATPIHRPYKAGAMHPAMPDRSMGNIFSTLIPGTWQPCTEQLPAIAEDWFRPRLAWSHRARHSPAARH